MSMVLEETRCCSNPLESPRGEKRTTGTLISKKPKKMKKHNAQMEVDWKHGTDKSIELDKPNAPASSKDHCRRLRNVSKTKPNKRKINENKRKHNEDEIKQTKVK